MRPSGEFVIHLPGEVEHAIPNQFTVIGSQQVIKSAFWHTDTTWYVGLCAHNPADSVAMNQLFEPTIGVNGYQRQLLPLTSPNWPDIGVINGESYVESRPFTFLAVGAYNVQVSRLFITDGASVIAISSQLDGGLQTIVADLETTYRLYFR